MAQRHSGHKRIRKFYGKIREVAEMPNLIEVQKSSYDLFLQSGDGPVPHDGEGLKGTFQSVFPIKDFNETAVLEFVKYELEPPKYDVDECMQRDMTYAAPLKVTLRLIVFEVDEETGARSVKDIKEQDVYMGDMPLMTPNGTFIVNGTERVIVSQMHRSPGVFFDHDRGKTHSSGKLLFTSRVIPYRGSWLDFEFDAKDIVFARIDRRRKLPVTTLLYALGMDQDAIMAAYYDTVTYRKEGNFWATRFFPERLRGSKPNHDIINAAHRRDHRAGRQEDHPAHGQGVAGPRRHRRDPGAVRCHRRPLRRARHHQRGDRPDLGRGRRRADLGHRRQDRRRHRRHAEGAARQRHHRDPDARRR